MNTPLERISCKHFVVRKKRYCRMTVKAGDEYCGEHQPNSTGTENVNKFKNRRIVCPLDPKHTCYANKLKQHLKKCNAKPAPEVPYIHKNINSGGTGYIKANQPRLLSDVPVVQILDIISKVNQIHNDAIFKHWQLSKKNWNYNTCSEPDVLS